MAKKDYKYGKPYKFQALKLYSSSEWMANSTKKYRRVFEKDELSYLRAQFSFYNKLFDEEEWKAKIAIKAFDNKKTPRKEICSLSSEHTIKKDDNIFLQFHDGSLNCKVKNINKGDTLKK